MKYDSAFETATSDMTNAPKITPEYWWNDIMNENAKLETLWEAFGDELSIKDKQEWSKGKWSDMPKDVQNKIDNWARQSGGYEAIESIGNEDFYDIDGKQIEVMKYKLVFTDNNEEWGYQTNSKTEAEKAVIQWNADNGSGTGRMIKVVDNYNEAFAQTGGQYPSEEDDSDDYSFGMPASSPKYASKLKKNYHDNKTKDQTSLDDDAGNIGAVDEELKSQETEDEMTDEEWEKENKPWHKTVTPEEVHDHIKQNPGKSGSQIIKDLTDYDLQNGFQGPPSHLRDLEQQGKIKNKDGGWHSTESIGNELNEWDKPDTLNQKPDKAPLDIDAEPQEEQVEPTMGQESTGYKCRACGLYASSEDSANKHEDQFGKDHKMYYGDVYSKDEEALEIEQDKKYKCPDCKYGTEFPESFKMHARGQHDMGEDQINNIIGEVSLENMASDCGCDKGKEKFYKPIFESLGIDFAKEIDVTRADIGPADIGEMSDEDYKKYKAFLKKIGLGEATLQPYWGGWKDKDATKGKYKEMEPDPETNKKLKYKLDSITPGDHEDVQESFIKEWDGMNAIQRHEWLNNKVGIFEMLDKYVGVSNLKFKNQDMASQERLLKLAESNTYSYDFKKKVNVEYYRDPADFPDPHPKSACDICKTQYQDHGDKGDKVPANIKDEYDLTFDTWSHDWEGEGDYDDSDNEYDRRRDQELEDRHIGEARGGENGKLEVYPGDYVDFGPYGKHYVIDTDYFSSDGRTWWITDKEEDRRKSNASGWSISSSQAKRVIQSIDDADDEESDEQYERMRDNKLGY